MKNLIFKTILIFFFSSWIVGAILYTEIKESKFEGVCYLMYFIPLSLVFFTKNIWTHLLLLLAILTPIIEIGWYSHFFYNDFVGLDVFFKNPLRYDLCFNMFGLRSYLIFIGVIPITVALIQIQFIKKEINLLKEG